MSMNVTPLSMQMVVPQSTEAGQVQHNLNQAGALQQAFEDVRQKEDARLKQQQVRNKDNPEDGRIKDDPEHRNKGSYESRRNGARQEAEEEEPKLELFARDPSRGQFLDIRY